MAKAIEYYQAAIQIAPDYAPAYSGLAAAYSKRGTYLIVPPKESYALARPNAEKALTLDPQSADAHSELALIAWLYDWNWDLADREFRRAVELNPESSSIHERYANFLGEMNRRDEAIAEAQLAVQIDPLSALVRSDLGYVYFTAGRYDEARDAIKEAKERLMGRSLGNFTPIAILISEQAGDIEQLAELVSPDSELRRAVLKDGVKGYWHKQLDHFEVDAEDWPSQYSYRKAELLARLGENNRAIKELEKAYETHHHCMTGIKVDAAFDGLRNDPRFKDLLIRMHL
ncbi:MAG: tetratricopeptide repeat protein [Acidobacteria bacterium]|nr:tetratricopeptide repeat protein [Acidobacteriota bacterium]